MGPYGSAEEMHKSFFLVNDAGVSLTVVDKRTAAKQSHSESVWVRCSTRYFCNRDYLDFSVLSANEINIEVQKQAFALQGIRLGSRNERKNRKEIMRYHLY